MEDIVVIGGGPAGATAAIYASRANLKTVVLDKNLVSGALGMTEKIENYPGFPLIKGSTLVRKIRAQAKKFGAVFQETQALGVDFSGDVKIIFATNGQYKAKAVILATGSMGRAAGTIPGEENYTGRGVSYCATCDGAFYRGKKVAVVGDNEEALREAQFLTRFVEKVYLVTKKQFFPVELASKKIELVPQAHLTAVNGSQVVESISFRQNNRDKKILVQGVFIYLQGNRPVTGFLNNALPTTKSGCLIVNENMETDLHGIYAAGDVLCPELKQAVVAAAEGCKAAMNAIKYLLNKPNINMDWKTKINR